MAKMLIIDHEKCTGCRLCELVCSVYHSGVSNPTRSRIHIVKFYNQGIYIPMVCQQCKDAACMAVCPKDAIYRDAELGRVMINYDLCIGCKMCVAACPFGGMGVDKEGTVIKCDLCDGDPQCVRFCDMKAVDYVEASTVNVRKKREAVEDLAGLMSKFVG
ncbi:MAG: 4Fe-4S dicluster domain-containing protein [Deltaproteobacteria bacterium]|nr:MAG: 4Fe-4S dicluster domain-containing protein [Deltaproteobacteria bacterium]